MKAKGVGIGDKIADIQAKFPHATIDHTGESVFELTFVNIPKQDGGLIQFGVAHGHEEDHRHRDPQHRRLRVATPRDRP